MAIKHAPTLDDDELRNAMLRLDALPNPLIMRAVFAFSYYSGLRAQEIAGLEWEKNLLDASGRMRSERFVERTEAGAVRKREYPVLFVSSDIGKYGNERTIPLHDSLVHAIRALMPTRDRRYVIPSGNRRASQALGARAHAIQMRIKRAYKAVGLPECSSHSGRRTFITRAARRANLHHASLADVQKLAGHSDLKTTEAYIAVSPEQGSLVTALY